MLAHRALDKNIPVYRLEEVPLEEAQKEAEIAQERMLRLAGATKEEINKILHRTKTTMMAERRELTIEDAELLAALEKQYEQMTATLASYQLFILKLPMPSWEQIKGKLNAEMLEKARKLEEPTLLVVPPVSRQAMVEAIDAHKVSGQTNDTYTYELGDDNLWNGGKPEGKEPPWEVTIVTGVRDVKASKAMIKGTNYHRAKAWVEKYEGQGLDVINDARTYLTLMMRSLTAGKPIDKKFWTVLNAKNLTGEDVREGLVARGWWCDDRVCLNGAYPVYGDRYFRSRGAVRIL